MRVNSKLAQKRTQGDQATSHVGWGQPLIIIGLIGTLAGSMDPLEGAALILPGVALIALGAILAKSQLKMIVFWSFVFTAIGVGAMILLSLLGGVGGNSGRSLWWLALLIPYAVGVVFSFIGGVIALIETLGDDGISTQPHR